MLKKQLATLLCFLFVMALPLSTYASSIDEVREIVQDNYVGDIDGNLNKATTIKQMMDMLDPYSTYFTAEEFEEFISGVELTTVGIGIVIDKVKSGIHISELIDGGSAKAAGLHVGDIITAIDGKSTINMTIDQASSRIKGAENTTVSLTVLRKDGSILKKVIERKAFSLPNVESKLLYNNVGYISLNSFSNDTVSLVSKAIKNLKKQGATSFIFDLQNNGGGYVTAAEQLIGMFPNAPYAYKLKEKNMTSNVRSIKQATQFPKQTKVLINKNSASASEMTAAALVDQNAAILYGQTTYGKGAMQGFFELEDGSFLKLTIGHFYGPKGTAIQNRGIKPHVTTVGNALYQAHFDSIVSNLANYTKHSSLTNVPTNKAFTATFSNAIAPKIATSAIQFVELGGNIIEADFKITGQQLVITPKKPLIAGKEYMLIVHPKVKTATGKSLIKGIYLQVTVKK